MTCSTRSRKTKPGEFIRNEFSFIYTALGTLIPVRLGLYSYCSSAFYRAMSVVCCIHRRNPEYACKRWFL